MHANIRSSADHDLAQRISGKVEKLGSISSHDMSVLCQGQATLTIMDTLISPSSETGFEDPAHGQPSIDLDTSSLADVITANDSRGSAAAQSSPDSNVTPPESFLKSTKSREFTVMDSSDTSHSGKQDLVKESRPSKSNDEANATFGDKVKEVYKQVVKCGQYLQEMADQVAEWEEKIRKLVSRDNEDWKISEKRDTEDWTIAEEGDNEDYKTSKENDFEALPIVPTISLVNWTDFKNVSMQTQKHATDVVVGEAKAYPQRHENEKQNVDEGGHGDLSYGSLAEKTPPSLGAAASQGDVPNQVRINSKILLQMMSDASTDNWEIEPTLMTRPYGLLRYCEPEFQKVLDRLEAKWADTERDQLVQISPSHNSPLVTAEKEQPIALAGAGYSETHAKVHGISGKYEIVPRIFRESYTDQSTRKRESARRRET